MQDSELDWKFIAHWTVSGKGLTKEMAFIPPLQVYRETGRGRAIYYVADNKKNFPSLDALLGELKVAKQKV